MKVDEVIKQIMDRKRKQQWRMKRGRQILIGRAMIVDVLHKAGRPLSANELAWTLNRSYQGVGRELKVLDVAKVICSRVETIESQEHYYTICPVCPQKLECEHHLEIWKNAT